MKKSLLFLTALTLFTTLSFAQTVVLDFEDPATSTDFQFFGGDLEGTLSQVIDNPNSSGINTSAKVLEFKKAQDAPEWGGGFSNPNPTTAVDLTNSQEVCIDYHSDHIGSLSLKLENSSDGGGNWLQTQPNTVVNDWEKICFDVTQMSEEPPTDPAAGFTYSTVTLFLDFGTAGTGTEVVSYIDNIVVSGSVGTVDLNVVDNLFEMTPTLVSDNALITFENTSGDRQLSVVSTMGQVLVDQNIDGSVPNFEIQTANWTPGLYMARVQQGKDMQVVKFLVH